MERNNKEHYAYIKIMALFYWVEKRRFFSAASAGNNLMLTQKELNEARASKDIPDFDSICYRKGGADGCLNLLEESSILKPSSNPMLDGDIKHLIENVAGYKAENIEYLHKAILYKHANINDFTIPCVVFAWKGWSGKGTFISLMATIFWEENVMSNLGQRELTSSFDTYKGQKLIVEFAEVTTNNTHWDKKILNKLKNIIGVQQLTVNEKWVQPYQIDNIAWFFISSNSNKPLQLDDKDKWNRRFSIIISEHKLQNWELVNKSIKEKSKAEDYLAWLYQTYPEVLEYRKLEALDNQDKRDLEERSQEEANTFWEWVSENHPEFTWKRTIAEIDDLISMFCMENGINFRDFRKYFWNNSKHPKKKFRKGDRTFYWVELS